VGEEDVRDSGIKVRAILSLEADKSVKVESVQLIPNEEFLRCYMQLSGQPVKFEEREVGEVVSVKEIGGEIVMTAKVTDEEVIKLIRSGMKDVDFEIESH